MADLENFVGKGGARANICWPLAVADRLVIGDDSCSRSRSVVIQVVSRLCLVACPSYAPAPRAELELMACLFCPMLDLPLAVTEG